MMKNRTHDLCLFDGLQVFYITKLLLFVLKLSKNFALFAIATHHSFMKHFSVRPGCKKLLDKITRFDYDYNTFNYIIKKT